MLSLWASDPSFHTYSINIIYFRKSNKKSFDFDAIYTELLPSVYGFDSYSVKHLFLINLVDDCVLKSHNLTVQSYEDVRNVELECLERPIKFLLWALLFVIYIAFL
jgi:hypothetical protein